jgi:hypothetical protein
MENLGSGRELIGETHIYRDTERRIALIVADNKFYDSGSGPTIDSEPTGNTIGSDHPCSAVGPDAKITNCPGECGPPTAANSCMSQAHIAAIARRDRHLKLLT